MADVQNNAGKNGTLIGHTMNDLVLSTALEPVGVPVLESSVMSGPEKIRSRGSWSHIVSNATDA